MRATTGPRGALGIALLLLLSSPTIVAQLTEIPDLETVTNTNGDEATTTESATGDATSDATTDGDTETTTNTRTTGGTTARTTATTADETTTTTTSDDPETTTTDTASSVTVTSAPTLTSTGGSVFSLSDIPTIAGAGIPTMIVPNTNSAPYMQKSSVPEGTFFIAVGAVLGFLGFCVIAWRATVAWSVERSVKKAALASVMATDDKTGWPSNPFKSSGPVYSKAPNPGSSLSLDALTSAGKPVSTARAVPGRQVRPLVPSGGSGLFFSPTASIVQGGQGASAMPSIGLPNSRSSSYLPAGYYANPATQTAGGASQTTLGGAGNANNRPNSTVNVHSPPQSPDRGTPRRTPQSNNRLGVGAADRDSHRLSSRPISALVPQQGLSSQASNNSLMVGTGPGHEERGRVSNEQGRAPSAYLDDLFGGSGPQNGGAPH